MTNEIQAIFRTVYPKRAATVYDCKVLLYRTVAGWTLQTSPGPFIRVPPGDRLTTREDLYDYLEGLAGNAEPPSNLLPPIEAQEVWAAGVTYYRSRSARMAESQITGGGDFYDRM